MFKSIAAAAVASVALMAGTASALPTFTSGSFTISANTGETGNVVTTSSFLLSDFFGQGQVYGFSSATGDFTGEVPLFQAPDSTTLTFNTGSASTFNFTNAVLGNFTAATVNLLGTSSSGNSVTVSYDVEGSFVLGTEWDNGGSTQTANETWSLTQTGGPSNAISLSATFHSPAVPPTGTPEPATLSLFGAALAGLGLARRRRK